MHLVSHPLDLPVRLFIQLFSPILHLRVALVTTDAALELGVPGD
jgi:hypothetical protein